MLQILIAERTSCIITRDKYTDKHFYIRCIDDKWLTSWRRHEHREKYNKRTRRR